MMPGVYPDPADQPTVGAPASDRASERLRALERLALAAEARLDGSGHARRVAELAGLLARKVGMPADDVELIKYAAPFHDLGLIGIPDKILLKPGRLSSDEFEVIKGHVGIGANMLSFGDSNLLELARTVVLNHHERFDGSGYPNAVKGDAIPLPGQIVALTDFFDTLTRKRPYRPAWSVDEAIRKIRRRSGNEFNPRLVTAFLRVLTEHDERQRAPTAAAGVRIQGSADLDTLYDMLVSLTQNGKSGELRIYPGLSEGSFQLESGQLIHAELDGAQGEAAVLKLMNMAERYPQMEFIFDPEVPAPDRATIWTPTQQLLLRTAVALDNHRVDREEAA